MVTFATSGPDAQRRRFINYAHNSQLDRQDFTPFGRVVTGMDVVDSFYAEYGEGASHGAGPLGPAPGQGSVYTKAISPRWTTSRPRKYRVTPQPEGASLPWVCAA